MLITGNAGTNGTNGLDGTQIYISTGANYSGAANENDLNIDHQIFSGTFLTALVPLMRPVLLAAMRPDF